MPSGSDRLAEACTQLGLADDAIVVNVQGDEPLIEPVADRRRRADTGRPPRCGDEHGRARDRFARGLPQPERGQDGARCPGQRALFQPRADPVVARRLRRTNGPTALPAAPAPLRHIGIYGYRAGFVRRFPRLPPAPVETTEALEQLRALWHGYPHRGARQRACSPARAIDTPEDLARVRALFARR